jgi:hypothetical protein
MTIATNKGIQSLDNNQIETMYLDYFNNYLTIDKFAEHNQISWFSAKSIINKGRLINHNK